MEGKNQIYKDIKNQSDAVLYFLQQLDIEMIDSILDPNRTYQNLEKHLFIQKLGVALDKFIQSGDTYLNRHQGHCNSKTCNYKGKGFSFIGNNSGNYINLIIEIKEGIVLNIYECYIFNCLTKIASKNDRIEIEKLEPPF